MTLSAISIALLLGISGAVPDSPAPNIIVLEADTFTLGVAADGRTLFICAAPDFHEHARVAATEARLLAVRVDVPHAGRP